MAGRLVEKKRRKSRRRRRRLGEGPYWKANCGSERGEKKVSAREKRERLWGKEERK